MRSRLLRFLAGAEFGVMTSLLFAGLYTWPFLTFTKPGATFRFIFGAWIVHIALIAAAALASKRTGSSELDAERESLHPSPPSAE